MHESREAYGFIRCYQNYYWLKQIESFGIIKFTCLRGKSTAFHSVVQAIFEVVHLLTESMRIQKNKHCLRTEAKGFRKSLRFCFPNKVGPEGEVQRYTTLGAAPKEL